MNSILQTRYPGESRGPDFRTSDFLDSGLRRNDDIRFRGGDGVYFLVAVNIIATTLFLIPAHAEQTAHQPIAPSTVAGPWLKLYPIDPYAQYWHVRLKVHNVSQSTPHILSALKKAHGEPMLPVANMAASRTRAYQQLSYRFSTHGADNALKRLRQLGSIELLIQSPAPSMDPRTPQEVQDKLKELKVEIAQNKDALARMPAVSKLTSEMLDHLNRANAIYDSAKNRILINIEIFQEEKLR